ncbi:Card1-like endonuclease domain-containing protein [Chryseobacterium bernardetii]|uniref:Card1-like endonuclease domain-containing protein n=1 Tax=Chryseobacterium bernardetii TaxID=1241978 RepID=UPI003AF9BBD2
MKHQITFVGGQLLPVIVGIKEFSPDKIHFFVSEESKDKISLLKPFLSNKMISEKKCDPFDFTSIKVKLTETIKKIDPTDEVQFNLTGGTKIMVLAAQAIMQEMHLKGFYINLNNTFLELPSYKIKKITSEITTREFFEMTGHKIRHSKNISDFPPDDFKSVSAIESFSLSYDKLLLLINSKIRKTYDNNKNIPVSGQLEITKTCKFCWTANKINVTLQGRDILKIDSLNVRTLFFNAGWWELVVAKEISKWSKAKELLIQCELPFKTDVHTTKNEIDILVNIGGKLIFIECKSGAVKQEDINKMRIVKDTYGGLVSKSLLVCRYMPSTSIIEKCKELNIEIFYCLLGKNHINSIGKIIGTLEKLEKKITI